MKNAFRAKVEEALNHAARSYSFVLMTPEITKANRHALAIRQEALRDVLKWLDEEDETEEETPIWEDNVISGHTA